MGSCGIRALLLVAKLLVLLYFAPNLDQSTVTQETHMQQTQALILVSGNLYARDGNPMWCWAEIQAPPNRAGDIQVQETTGSLALLCGLMTAGQLGSFAAQLVVALKEWRSAFGSLHHVN